MRERAKAAFDVLAAHELVDPSRIAAIGFCFGGTCCLELAYSGANLAGVVTFHGGLTAPQVQAWEDGMRKAGVDWQLIAYGGAMHTFSNPEAGTANKAQGVAYDPKAADRSWQHVQQFFGEIFKEPRG